MSRGISLHIGLNFVDPNAYNGWDGQLSGCINDANDMQQIAVSMGFEPSVLIDGEATAYNVVSRINSAAENLNAGDFFLITYSGHGGQLPDEEGFEEDGLNETWVLYDRELLDNELYALWTRFASGVRIFVTSDSCHSGTVIKMMLRQQLRQHMTRSKSNGKHLDLTSIDQVVDEKVNDYKRSYRSSQPAQQPPRLRFIPPHVSMNAYLKRRGEYRMYSQLAGRKSAGSIAASLIFISGCQDNQFSYDGDDNGLFTGNLLKVWNNRNFEGSYYSFYQQILAMMPSYQTPNYLKLGVQDAAFEGQLPYLIATGAAEEPQDPAHADPNPHVTGPESWGKDVHQPPTFAIHKGANPYYYLEITSEHQLFDTTTYGSSRNAQNFYATWMDPQVSNRLTSNSFTLPVAAWQNLLGADKLYYRIGTTSSPQHDQWNNFIVSTYDDESYKAPCIQLEALAIDEDYGGGGTPYEEEHEDSDEVSISHSVGRGGRNASGDVRTVQQLLNGIAYEEGGPSPLLSEDGMTGSKTIAAIERFQRRNYLVVDGLITPKGETFALLKSKSRELAM